MWYVTTFSISGVEVGALLFRCTTWEVGREDWGTLEVPLLSTFPPWWVCMFSVNLSRSSQQVGTTFAITISVSKTRIRSPAHFLHALPSTQGGVAVFCAESRWVERFSPASWTGSCWVSWSPGKSLRLAVLYWECRPAYLETSRTHPWPQCSPNRFHTPVTLPAPHSPPWGPQHSKQTDGGKVWDY